MSKFKLSPFKELQSIKKASGYLDTLLRKEEYIHWLSQENNLYRRYPLTDLYKDLKNRVEQCHSSEDLLRAFRKFKQEHFLRIAGRELLAVDDFSQTVSQISELACVTLQVAIKTFSERPKLWIKEHNIKNQEKLDLTQRLVVMGLGKLGGSELNYVSDIDLFFIKEDRSKADRQLLRRASQKICSLISEQVQGDRVFQVDLRLRPMGKDGELISSLQASAEYYQNYGRAWERQALLKARPVAGARSLGQAFLQEVRPFVFRRFLDFQALGELKDMRDRILAEIKDRRGEITDDIKLGKGGIREIEFIVQSFQLVYGGRYRELDEPNTLKCLEKLSKLNILPLQAINELKQSYIFLRKTEHWIQLDQNRRSSRLPGTDKGQRRLAFALGYEEDWPRLINDLQECSRMVHGHFAALFQSRSGTGKNDVGINSLEEDIELSPEPSLEFSEYAEQMKKITGKYSKPVQVVIKRVLDTYFQSSGSELFPRILSRVENFLYQSRARPGLLSIIENIPVWLENLLDTTAKSGLVASLLAHQPSLVEGLTSQAGIWQDFEGWSTRAESIVYDCDVFEEAMEWIRRLKNERLLMIAMAELNGNLGQGEVSRELSRLADLIITYTYEWICSYLSEKGDLPLSIMALGKLGSQEFGYLSDLDLMFVYEPGFDKDVNKIPVKVVKLVQRLIRMLSTPLQEGPGYKVDTKLRPTGSYGPLIVTRSSWEDYYFNQADIWEIQSLLRMRAVAGDLELGQNLEQAAKTICYRYRTKEQVWPRLCHLRNRMEAERSGEKKDVLDLKLGKGGVADLEFMVQGVQLLYGYKASGLQYKSVEKCLPEAIKVLNLNQDSSGNLQSAFQTFKALGNRLELFSNQSTSKLNESYLQNMMAVGIWPINENNLHKIENMAEIMLVRRRVRSAWDTICKQQGT